MSADNAEMPDLPARPRRLRFSLLTMFAVVTVICVIFGLTYHPHGAEAEIRFRVMSHPPAIGGDGAQFDAREFEIFQKTQITQIKGQWVIQAAIRDPSVRSVALLAEKSDPVAWLGEQLQVDFPDAGEILSIRLRGREDDLVDLKILVNAVAKAYEDEFLFKYRQQTFAEGDAQEKIVSDLRKGVEDRIRQLDALKGKLGEGDAAVKTAEIDLELRKSQWAEAAKKLQSLNELKNAPPRVQKLTAESTVRMW